MRVTIVQEDGPALAAGTVLCGDGHLVFAEQGGVVKTHNIL